MDFKPILGVILLAIGAVVGTFPYTFISAKVPYGSYVAALVGIAVAIYSTKIDGTYVDDFVEGIGIGMVIPAASGIFGFVRTTVGK